MATYTELRGLFNNSDLMGKVEVALIIAANAQVVGTPTASQINWAANVFNSPRREAEKALMSVLADNNTATVEQIIGSSDTAIQTGVDNIVDVLIAAGA